MATTTAGKPQLAPLKTPASATSTSFPSELRTPAAGTPTFIKLEDSLQRTPLTPPPAYLDFLKTLSPTLVGPASTTRTTFPDRPGPPTSASSTDTVVTLASDASDLTATSQSRSTTSDSSASFTCTAGTNSNPASRSSSRSSLSRRSSIQDRPGASETRKEADLKVMIPPASPFVRPHSARTPRHILIPQSPRSAGSRTPLSAHSSIYSPYSAVMSPHTVDGADLKSPQVPHSAPLYGVSKPVNVSVRQVVTRTVVYSSRQGANAAPVVDPVPASKKRKTDGGSETGGSAKATKETKMT